MFALLDMQIDKFDGVGERVNWLFSESICSYPVKNARICGLRICVWLIGAYQMTEARKSLSKKK